MGSDVDTPWGVDSWNPANAKIGGKTLFEIVTKDAGTFPQFWGRYVGGSTPPLSNNEADFIFHESGGACRILVAYNSLHNGTIPSRGCTSRGAFRAVPPMASRTRISRSPMPRPPGSARRGDA
jgi:hypothetical protein